MQKLLGMTKVALIGCTLATGATGCCLWSNDSCDDKTCCEKKTRGMNTSMTVGVGTDGMSVSSESNLGSHGASGSLSTH